MGSTGVNAGPMATSAGQPVDVSNRTVDSRVLNVLDMTSLSLGARFTDEERTRAVNDALGNNEFKSSRYYDQLKQWAKEHGGKRRFSNLK